MTNKNKTLIALALILALGFGLVIGTHFTQLAMTDTVTNDTADDFKLAEVDRIVLACLAEANENGLNMDVTSVMPIDEPTPPALGDKWMDATIEACNDHLSTLGLQLDEVGFWVSK